MSQAAVPSLWQDMRPFSTFLKGAMSHPINDHRRVCYTSPDDAPPIGADAEIRPPLQ